MVLPDAVRTEDEQQYYEVTDQIQLKPGWLQGEGQPLPVMEPYLWRWAEVEPLVLKSGELVTPDRDVERRTLRLATPGSGSRDDSYHNRRAATAAARRVRAGAPAYAHGHPVDPEGRRARTPR